MSNQPKRQLVVTPLPNYEPEIGRWMWALEDTRNRTRNVLPNITESQLDRRNTSTGHNIGTLLYHIAAIELDWLANEVMEGKLKGDPIWELFPFDVRDDAGRLTYVSGQSLDDHWQRLGMVRATLQATFQEMTITEFRRIRDLPDYRVTPEWVLHHLCQHEALHRDELIALANIDGKVVE